jgi:CheY-like chemotaxis protein
MSRAILIVDDERGIREMLHYELSLEGFDVETADSGMAAIEALRRRRFDLAVTDLKMPGMDGVATVEALRAIDPDIAVIVATGYASVQTAVACMKKGAFDYITKPYDLDDLKRLLDRAMEKNHLQGVVALYDASRALLGTLAQADLIDLVVTLARSVLRADESGLVLRHATGGPALHRRDTATATALDATFLDLARTVDGGEPTRTSLPGGGCALTFPLVAGERTLGALVVIRGVGSPSFSGSELQKGAVFAGQLTLSLDNARLYQEVEGKLAELVATREHLVLAEKLALAGRLAGAVGHEVNNPLAAVRVNLDQLRDYSSDLGALWFAAKAAAAYLRQQPDPAAARLADGLRVAGADGDRTEEIVRDVATVIDESLEAVRRIADLVAGFAELAAPQLAGACEVIDVGVVLEDCVTSLPPPARQRIHIVRPVRPMLACVGAKDVRTGLLNLLSFVSAAGPAPSQPVAGATVSVAEAGGNVCVELTNPGLRLSKAERRQLFDPRVGVLDTGRSRTMRLDLSLALGYQLLSRNGADISVVDAREGGVAIRVSLPRTARARRAS